MSIEEIRQRTQAVWDRFYSLKLIWKRSRFVPSLRSRLAFIFISKLYRQMYANTGLATDSARAARSARWLAKPCRYLFSARPIPQLRKPGPTCSFPKTDWRGAVNTNRWLSLSSETSLLAAALEKYDPISALALPLRQTCDVCPGDSRAFWAGKSPFRAERNRETENGRLAGRIRCD